MRDNKLESCYIRPIVFYGSDAMGVAAKSNPVRVAIAAWPWGAYLGAEALEKGIRVKTSSFTHHHPNITMCSAKAVGNYAISILANQEATHDGYDEAMLLDPQGFVCQGSGENVFIVRDGKLHTPDLSGGALNGITRDTIITFAHELGIPVIERRITRDEVYIADEAFFTGTAAEVTPIRELDNRAIGDGARGPITEQLQTLFFDTVNGRNPSKKAWLTQGVTMAETDDARRRSRSSRRTCRCSARIRRCRCGRAHPRVFLDIAETGEAMCPYCGTRYRLAGGPLKGGGH